MNTATFCVWIALPLMLSHTVVLFAQDTQIERRDGEDSRSSPSVTTASKSHSVAVGALDLRLTPDDQARFIEKYGAQVLAASRLEEVEVLESRERLPYWNKSLDVWPGPMSLVWGLTHPLSAWRVIAPIAMEE